MDCICFLVGVARDSLIQDTLALKEVMVFREGLQLLDLPDRPSRRSQNTLDQSLSWEVVYHMLPTGPTHTLDSNLEFAYVK